MSEIEKEFFDTFGVEAKYKCTKDGNCYFQECSKCDWYIHTYPQITDRRLLELICILNKHYSEHYQIASMIVGKNIEEVKKSILNDCIEQSKHKDFKHQVQAIFKENNYG